MDKFLTHVLGQPLPLTSADEVNYQPPTADARTQFGNNSVQPHLARGNSRPPQQETDPFDWLASGIGLIDPPTKPKNSDSPPANSAPAPIPSTNFKQPSQSYPPYQQSGEFPDFLADARNPDNDGMPTEYDDISEEVFKSVALDLPKTTARDILNQDYMKNLYVFTEDEKAKISSGDFAPYTQRLQEAHANAAYIATMSVMQQLNDQLPKMFHSAMTAYTARDRESSLKQLVNTKYRDSKVASFIYATASAYRKQNQKSTPQAAIRAAEAVLQATLAQYMPTVPSTSE